MDSYSLQDMALVASKIGATLKPSIATDGSVMVNTNGSDAFESQILTYEMGQKAVVGTKDAVVTASQSLMSPLNILALIFAIIAVRTLIVTVYRLYFHPLAHFPGPKLAASSRLYEFYYQAIRNTEFPNKIKTLHDKYGPIVRISPEELSLNDSEFNIEYFVKDRKIEKDPWYYSFGYDNAIVAVLDKVTHKTRQTHLMHHFGGHYFQQNAFPTISTEVSELRSKFGMAARAGETFDLTIEFRKMCNEVLRNFLLGGKSWESDDNGKNGRPAQIPLFQAISTMRQFPFLKQVQDLVPSSFVVNYIPMAKYAHEAEVGIQKLIDEYDNSTDAEKAKQTGVLYRLIEAEPAYRANNCAAAMEEFMELLWGGREAVSSAITQICYQLLRHPEHMAKLHEELSTTSIDLKTASFGELQRLPYLYGVCKEGIRLTWGGAFRMPRVNSQPVQYNEFHIPANTPISMSPNFFHQDAKVFEEPTAFIPARWNGPDAARLEHYWKPFGNGSRGCQGRNMAIELVWRTTANIFSAYKIDWDGCDEDSIWADGTLKVFPPKSAGGLTVQVGEW